jgi:hypothetical protein
MEHRMFCHITRNWRAKPLIDCMTIIALIRTSSTKEGLVIRAEIDPGVHETGITVTDEQLASINIERCSFHGDWNYSIMPSKI